MQDSLSSLLADIMRAPKKAKPAKAYSYLRFSTPEQMAGDSFRRQTELAQRYAEAHGLTLDEELTYRDLGVSGFHGTHAQRGRLADFLDAVEKGVVPRGSFLLIENLDRLSRQTPRKALRTLESIVEAGVIVVTLMDGKQFTAASLDGFDLFHALFTMVRAHEESATKQRRAKEAWKASLVKAAKGEARGASSGPAWLRPSADGKAWEPIPERVEVVKRAFKLARSGVGKDSIAKTFNAEGVPTFDPKAKQWWGSYLFRLLSSRAVLGEHTPKERVEDSEAGTVGREPLKTIKDYYPAVVPKRLWDEVQAMQGSNPRRGRHAKAPVANILGGLGRCPTCDAAMTRVNKGPGPRAWPYLVCTAAKAGKRDDKGQPVCRYKSVGYTKVEDALISNVAQISAEAPAANAKARALTKKREGADAALDTLNDELENLLRVAAGAKGTRPAALVARIQAVETERTKVKETLAAIDAQLAGAEASLVAARLKELRQEAAKAPIDRTALNAALRRLLSGVVVDYNTGELRFRWHHADHETALAYDAGAALFE